MQTSKFEASRNVLVVLVGSLCFCSAASPVPYVVEFTSPEQFEHQTQASTGQTTGSWFVMFLSNKEDCNKCRDGVASLESLAERQLGDVIWAKMNTELFPEFVQRFNLRFFPTGILFKDRKMHVFVPSEADTSPETILNFVESVSDAKEGETVPPVPSLLNTLSAMFEKQANQSPALIYGGLGALAVGLALLIVVSRLRSRPNELSAKAD